MTVLKEYVPGVGWQPILAGTPGPPGPPGDDGLMAGASTAETIAGTASDKAVTPAGLAGAATVYDVRKYGAKGDGTTDDTAAIQNAINAANSGANTPCTVFFPKGNYVVSSTLTLPVNYVTLQGVAQRGSIIKYSGNSIAVYVTATQKTIIRNLGIENTGTGTIGLQLGAVGGPLIGAVVEDVDIQRFSTSGLYVCAVELLTANRIWCRWNGIGFDVRHAGAGPSGMANRFVSCRAEESVNEGWSIDKQICPTFTSCESINSGPTGAPIQFRVGYAVYAAHVDRLDVERTGGSFPAGGVGVRAIGEYCRYSIMGYGLDVGIDVVDAKGPFIETSRFGGAMTTANLRIGSGATRVVVVDPGNWGTIVNNAPAGQVAFIGANATTAETIAGTISTKAVTPAGLAATLAVYDVREYGAKGDGTTDDTAAFQAAIDACGGPGGIVRVPIGNYRINGTLTVAEARVWIIGDCLGGSQLSHYGTGALLDINGPGNYRIENLWLDNAGDTGTHGIIAGPNGPNGNGTEFRRLKISGFLTAQMHLANCELTRVIDVEADGEKVGGIGFLINASRMTAIFAGMENSFYRCRAMHCTGYGWDIDQQIALRVINCESLSNGAAHQVIVRSNANQCVFEQFDIEDVDGGPGWVGGTTIGIWLNGGSHYFTGNFYKLATAILTHAFNGTTIGPCRFATVTTPLNVESSAGDMLIVDGGNLGTVSDNAPAKTHFTGLRTRSNRVEVSGTAGAGYLDFVSEQTANPAAATNRARVFTKDNGSNKTQLCVQFGTGSPIVIATEA